MTDLFQAEQAVKSIYFCQAAVSIKVSLVLYLKHVILS